QGDDRKGCAGVVHDNPLPFISRAAGNTRPASWRFRGECAASETLRQPGKKGPARTELRVADTDPRAVADLVDLVEQVEDVKAEFQTFVNAGVDRLNNAEVHLLIARQAVAVGDRTIGDPAGVGCPQTA